MCASDCVGILIHLGVATLGWHSTRRWSHCNTLRPCRLKIEMEPIHNPKTPRFKRPGSAKQVPKPVYHTAADGGAVRMFGNPVAEGAPSEGSESSTSSDP